MAKCCFFCALLGGGNWNNGAQAGARAVNLNNYPWNVNVNIGGRGACDLVSFRHVALRSGGTTKVFIPLVRTLCQS